MAANGDPALFKSSILETNKSDSHRNAGWLGCPKKARLEILKKLSR